jgi:regulator of cell morphogenesis and NO signaling
MRSAVDAPELLDCGRLTPNTCPDAVLEAFDLLAPGQRVRLLCAEAPVTPLEALRRERRGAFEWSPVREGPASWQVDVERRAAPVGSIREVTEALVWDHARLDALEAAAFEARARGVLASAREIFTDFAHGLRRHIDFEEQLLFPEFEARCQLAGGNGPTAVMRAEHRTIVSLLLVMEREIDDAAAPIELSRAELRQIQRDHDLKEEQILYPALDRLLDEEEGDRMVARIQAWSRG